MESFRDKTKDNVNDIDRVLDRAKRDSLTTDNVIYRAVNDILIDPNRIDIRGGNGCKELQSIYRIDVIAADEVRKTNEAMLKLSAAATESSRRSLEGAEPNVLRESYQIGRLVEGRIRERATLINLRLGRECLSSSDSPEYNYSERESGRGRERSIYDRQTDRQTTGLGPPSLREQRSTTYPTVDRYRPARTTYGYGMGD